MTEAAKHTTGPWKVNGSHIYAPDGNIIAVVYNPGSRSSDYPLVRNRNLMAAAPDLLDALRECQATLAMMVSPNSIEQTTVANAFATATAADAKARAAISKATA